MNAIFSDLELRRYPLASGERRLTRHLIGIVDPFWFLFLGLRTRPRLRPLRRRRRQLLVRPRRRAPALRLQLSAGPPGRARAWTASCSAKAAPPFSLELHHGARHPALRRRRRSLSKNPAIVSPHLQRLAYTPPFAAAAAMMHPDATGLRGLAVLVWWSLGLVAALVWMENRPPQRRAAESSRSPGKVRPTASALSSAPTSDPSSPTGCASTCATAAPGFSASFRFRCSPSSPSRPASAGPVQHVRRRARAPSPSSRFLGVSRIALNHFGYSGGAFRRYFLLPVSPAATLRAASYAASPSAPRSCRSRCCSGCSSRPIRSMRAWSSCSPAAALTGLFAFNACGIWVTLYNPRKGNYSSSFGNDLSLGGNVVLIGGVMFAMLLPRLLYKLWPGGRLAGRLVDGAAAARAGRCVLLRNSAGRRTDFHGAARKTARRCRRKRLTHGRDSHYQPGEKVRARAWPWRTSR